MADRWLSGRIRPCSHRFNAATAHHKVAACNRLIGRNMNDSALVNVQFYTGVRRPVNRKSGAGLCMGKACGSEGEHYTGKVGDAGHDVGIGSRGKILGTLEALHRHVHVVRKVNCSIFAV